MSGGEWMANIEGGVYSTEVVVDGDLNVNSSIFLCLLVFIDIENLN